MKRTGDIYVSDTEVHVLEPHVDDAAMGVVFKRLLGRLGRRGWRITRDAHIEEHYPLIGARHRRGVRGDLRCRAKVYGRHIEILFYQDESHENPYGGEYDFRKLQLMTRKQRLGVLAEMTSLVRKAFEMGYVARPSFQASIDRARSLGLAVRDLAEGRDIYGDDEPLERFNAKWNFGDAVRFRRDASGWPAVEEYDRGGRNRDRDGSPIRNGEVRYMRCRQSGRLLRGVAYTNMNTMWVLATGVGRRFVQGGELFFCDRPDIEPRRLVPEQGARLERECKRALEAKDFRRVQCLAGVRARLAEPEAAQ